MQPKYRAPFLMQLSSYILLWPFRLYHIISTNTEKSVLSMHCAGTQDATYATWSHLDHTCAYVVNMVLQKKKNRVNMVLNMNVWRKSFLPRNTKAKRFLLSQSCRIFCLQMLQLWRETLSATGSSIWVLPGWYWPMWVGHVRVLKSFCPMKISL